MTKSFMFTEAHKQAKIEARQYGLKYSEAFGNALRGFYMANRGYTGSFVR